MNELMHEVINKFHIVNIMCGSLALEIESDKIHAEEPTYWREKISQLSLGIDGELKRARKLLIEITTIMAGKINCYHDNEHFLKEIESSLSFLDNKSLDLKNNVKEANLLNIKDMVAFLHTMEEKALSCAVSLKDLKECLIRSGIYKPKN